MSLMSFIERYFRDRGCVLISPSELRIPEDIAKEIDLAVLDVKNIVVVKIIRDGLNRKLLLSAAMKAAVLREYADKVYLAAPMEYRLVIDGRVLSENGLGLLLVDESGNVMEVLPAKPKRTKRIPDVYAKAFSELEKQIEIIRRRFDELNAVVERVDRLMQEVEALRKEVEMMERELKEGRTRGGLVTTQVAREIEKEEELPSYLRDNPWLEILARRKED